MMGSVLMGIGKICQSSSVSSCLLIRVIKRHSCLVFDWDGYGNVGMLCIVSLLLLKSNFSLKIVDCFATAYSSLECCFNAKLVCTWYTNHVVPHKNWMCNPVQMLLQLVQIRAWLHSVATVSYVWHSMHNLSHVRAAYATIYSWRPS